MELIGELRGVIASDARWGRILAVEERTWRRAKLRVEVHEGDRPPVQRTITTWLPGGADPQVGQDVYVTPVRGEFYGVEQPYRIHWGREPRYGVPSPTPGQQRAYEQTVAASIMRTQAPATPTDPRWQLDHITAEHEAGRMSDADFAHYSEALKPYL